MITVNGSTYYFGSTNGANFLLVSNTIPGSHPVGNYILLNSQANNLVITFSSDGQTYGSLCGFQIVNLGTTNSNPPGSTADVTLAWDASTNPIVAGYNIYYGAASGTYTGKASTGLANSLTISNLAGGATYYFAATTYSAAGTESALSSEVSYTVPVSVVVNQPPTLNSINSLTLNENAGAQTVNLSGISSGGENQTLTVTAVSSNTGLIPNPSVNYASPNATGSLAFTPLANASGSAIVTVTVNDGGASNNIVSKTFTVTVNPVNQPPTLNSINSLTLNENAGAQTVNLSGISSGGENQTLTVTAVSSNTGLIPNPSVNYASPNATGSLAFTPLANASGSAIVTVTVNDGGASNNIVSKTFTVTVNPVNQPPTLNSINSLTLNENAGAQTVNLSGISSGGENQTLTVTAVSSNTGLIPNPSVNYASPNATGSLAFTPLANASGSPSSPSPSMTVVPATTLSPKLSPSRSIRSTSRRR